jgi:hypothetical protein
MPATLALYHLGLVSTALQQDAPSDFSDLGMKLLGGFVLAVVVAVAFTLIKLRWRDNRPPAEFISINSSKGKDES